MSEALGYLGRTLAEHWPIYLSEAAGLGTFMVSACVSVIALEHPASPVRRAISAAALRRAIVGLLMGLTAIGLIYSPLGRLSGAHLNPATTLTFALLGKVAPLDAMMYVLSQFAGAAAGVGVVALVRRRTVSHPAVNFVATMPGRRGVRIAWVVELLISAILMFAVLHVSNRPGLGAYTGFFAGSLVAIYITVTGPLSGMSMNPARTLGSAVFAGRTARKPLWVYFTAPPAGMLLAAAVFVTTPGPGHAYCAKLCPHGEGPCPFLCEYAKLAHASPAPPAAAAASNPTPR